MVYPNCKAMTFDDARRMDALNAKNGYGLSGAQLKRLVNAHRKARLSDDFRTMEKIEYRLTDINFHHECALLCRGEYETLRKELEKW